MDSLEISADQKKELLEIINKALSESEDSVPPEKSVAKGKFETFIKLIGDKAKKLQKLCKVFQQLPIFLELQT